MSPSSPPPQTPIHQRGNPLDDVDDSDASQVTLQRRSPLPPVRTSRTQNTPTETQTQTQVPAALNYSRPTLGGNPHPTRSPSSQQRTWSPTTSQRPPQLQQSAVLSPSPRPGDSPRRSEDNVTQRELGARLGHRPRQRSQGYFEPKLPSSTHATMSSQAPLNASQIAAQAAMHGQNFHHSRRRSTTIPEPGDAAQPGPKQQPTSPPQAQTPGGHTVTFKTNGITYSNGTVGGHGLAARTAANVVFPKSPLASPNIPQVQSLEHGSPKPMQTFEAPLKPVKESKSKMKLPFSKPKNIKLDSEKSEKKGKELPSPGKMGIGIHSSSALNRMMLSQAPSTTSLADSNSTGSHTFYSSANASTSTLVPILPEKEKHKHHFLSRQKHKHKDKDDHALPLSSASSNSKPTDPSAPQPLYSFAAPSSPGHTSSFANSVTGLDLRHGGRHLRQKKKEKEAAKEAVAKEYLDATLDPPFRERNHSFSTGERPEWPMLSADPSASPNLNASPVAAAYTPNNMANIGQAFGISGLTPDDAWPLLKARLLHIFEGEDPRPPVEDFNALVLVHMKRCIQKRSPIIIIEDLNELLSTGFSSLDQTLRHVPDDRLIPHLVEMWLVVFTTILPFLQAVFLPLDLEFKGRGLMPSTAAADFWGVLLPDEMNTKSTDCKNKNLPMLGELDVRRIILLVFRDTVMLSRFDSLMSIFSRLSLDNLNAGLESTIVPVGDAGFGMGVRPSTAGGMGPGGIPDGLGIGGVSGLGMGVGMGAGMASLQSTSHGSSSGSHLPDNESSQRSRATSNTSAGSFAASTIATTTGTRSLHSNSNPPFPTSTLHTISSNSSVPPQLSSSLPSHAQSSHMMHGSGGMGGPGCVPAALRPQPMDSSKITETVGRMLQCVSVLMSLQSGDEAQEKMGRLARELKYNWLGRGRTGRQRRGFVGPKTRKIEVGVGG